MKYCGSRAENVHPDSKLFLQENFYVNDGLGSENTIEKAVKILKDVKNNIRLHKITLNSKELLAHFPARERAQEIYSLVVEKIPSTLGVTLGVKWDPTFDHFLIEVNIKKMIFP